MPKCPKCGCLVESRAQKDIRVAKEDLKKSGSKIKKAIKHPKITLKKIFTQKPIYPLDCKRNCLVKNKLDL